MVWAMVKMGLNPEEVEPPAPLYDSLLPFPLTYLWFLYLLIRLYLLTLAGNVLVNRLPNKNVFKTKIDETLAKFLEGYLGVFILAVPIALLLLALPTWHWWGGIPTPDYSLDPNPVSLSIYIYVFLIGWVLDRQRHFLKAIEKKWLVNLGIDIAAVAICLTITGWRPEALTQIASTYSTSNVYLYETCYSIATISLTLVFIGLGMTFFNKENAAMRYLADASYWIYIWNLSVVFFFATLFMDVNIHWIVKCLLILVLALIPLVVTYDLFERSIFIGRSLNGKKWIEKCSPNKLRPATRLRSEAWACY
jgi:glucan biosynthesis protein C